MAKQEKNKSTEQSNIRLEIGVARTGLNLDSSIDQVGPGRLTYALNAAVENFDASTINYQNEPGNELCLDFPTGYKLIGSHFIPEKRKNVFFLANPNTGDSEIGYMDNNDCKYHTLVNATCLNFNINNPIPKVVHRITNCTTELYWTDGVNPRRYLDIENVPYKLTAGTPSCDPVYGNELDCNQLKIQPDFSIPQLMITQVRTEGSLVAGTYQFAVQYADASGNELTSYYSITNPLPIADEFITSVNFNYNVGKSIVVGVSNLDLTGQFQYFNLAVIKTINNISSAELVGTYNIEEATKEITYTGADQTAIRLSMSDIFEKFPYYDIAQDVTAVQDVIVWDNLTSIDRINYQSIANSIILQWETYRIPATENYADELNAVNLRGYMRDEVYAFEIVFLLKNGKQTDGFHIPGRERGSNEAFPDVPDTNSDFVGDPDYFIGTTGYKSYWKIYNTASVTGASSGYPTNSNYKGPWEYGEFAYWESTEEYPCNDDVWGELAGQPIRHHKFPDVLVSPIMQNGPIVYQNDQIVPAMQDNAVFPIGVKLDNSQIESLIQTSNLTAEQKDDIIGYKIVRGDRGTNKSVIAKGILRNVNQYTRDDQEYYYPNYPYNDLGGDPFVLANNNAFAQQSEPYLIYLPATVQGTSLIDIIQGNQIEVNGEQGVFEYTSPLNGKVTQATIELDEIVEICSLTRPIPILGKMVIGPGNYDVWRVYTDHGLLTCGHECKWTDPFTDWNDTPYVDSVRRRQWVDDDGALGTSDKYTIITNVGDTDIEQEGTDITNCDRPRKDLMPEQPFDQAIVDTPPGVKTGADYEGNSTSNDTWRNRRTRSRRSKLGCKEEKPQPTLEEQENGDVVYRQIFNSPDTSFGQPFLGSVLKLESVMFGGGKAHFVQVEDNAKYKLLSKEAQIDALNSSRSVAGLTDPFNAGVMFTVYQSYLTIYVNGITRKNYAMSFNSRANYDYSYPIDNGLGIKQRDIDFSRYLIPGVQSLGGGEQYSINNWNRETSVFIKTSEEREYNTAQSVNSILFPSDTPSLLTSSGTPAITDNSRFTIGSKGVCDRPGEEKDISVVSYYASMKNLIPNQWGQIYSYQTIDTGYQKIIGVNASSTVFGGDTFISRFAFKTKLPFFIDNRVNAPDDSDVFYDEIGNIGYPRYWHSSRSILEDYPGTVADPFGGGGMQGVEFTNIISYKAHNFDCPNDPATVPVGGGAARTFYDGYFYLFAYGIPNFYCETVYNTDLRQAFNNKEGDFWPHVSSGIPDDWLQETNVPIAQDNTYYYNVTYSKQNKENVFTHLPPDWQDDLCYTYFPFRAIYSDAATDSADVRVNNWLVYRALSFHDFPQNYGALTSLDGIQNKAILARFENKSLLYNNLLTIDTSNPQAAYIGNPRLFDSSPPIDFAETDLGYVGSQNKFLLKIPSGQITLDAKRGQVFLISGTQAIDLTGFGSGVNRFFIDHLPFEILQYFPNVDTDNHFNGIGVHGVYDSRMERVIITKLDYIPIDDRVQYDESTGEFYIERGGAAIIVPPPFPEPVMPEPEPVVPEPTDGIRTTTTTTTNKPIRQQVYLEDNTYFCNRSWTISFSFNTKSWISFHSYIPNFYIGENNFFYSGINGCCSTDGVPNLQVLAGRLLPVSTITTTTTAPLPVTPTTTTTSTTIDDVLEDGLFIPTDCSLAGTGYITVSPTTTTTCYSPSSNAIFDNFTEGYQIIGDSAVITTGSAEEACQGLSLLSLNAYESILPIQLSVTYEEFAEGQPVYVTNNTCNTVPEGWYFNSFTIGDNSVFYVSSGGYIQEIRNCNYCITTTSTTTRQPSLDECCGIIALTEENAYITSAANNADQINGVINLPGFVPSATAGVAFTSDKLWIIDTDIKEWDITLKPFTAEFNRSITYGETPSVAGNIAINNTTLIAVNSIASPQEILELDVTTTTAVSTSKFAIQANRNVISNLIYTTQGKLVFVSQDTVSSDHYITQYNYSDGTLELDVNIGTVSANIVLECNCLIQLLDVSGTTGTMYVFDPTGSITLVGSYEMNEYTTASQSASYITCGIENTTTSTTSTTSTTTTLSPTCNEYEVTGPTALYYTDCYGQQQILSVASGQTVSVCASVAIPGATLIGACT